MYRFNGAAGLTKAIVDVAIIRIPHNRTLNWRNNRAVLRWRAAQRLELDFWSRWTTLEPYRNLNIPEYWRGELQRFGETWECFRDARVLDIGCGPFGLIHYADYAAERIRVDPLLLQYWKAFLSSRLSGLQLSICALGESLPLADRSVDIVICHNALDHMLDPDAALDEIARVLRRDGTALLMIHTFPAWSRPLFPLDRMHPHHFTAESFAAMVGTRFRIERCETERRKFETSTGKWWLPSFWKYAAGNLVVSGTWIRAVLPE